MQLKDMCMWFVEIVNNLRSLRRTYTNGEMMRKILWCLLRSKWGPKVMTFEEA